MYWHAGLFGKASGNGTTAEGPDWLVSERYNRSAIGQEQTYVYAELPRHRRSGKAMSATTQRDRATSLAKSCPNEALKQARQVDEPWFRAQALAWVARFADSDVVTIAAEAAKAATEGGDKYQQCAVRAWEIAALAERDYKSEASKRLREALNIAKNVEPVASRSEALFLLFQASARIAPTDAEKVFEVLKSLCPAEAHWRCQRALRNGAKMMSGELQPRLFFW